VTARAKLTLVIGILAAGCSFVDSDAEKIEQLTRRRQELQLEVVRLSDKQWSALQASRLAPDSMLIHGRPANYLDSLKRVAGPAMDSLAQAEAQLQLVERDIRKLVE
jgi:hypothetical protein